RSDTAFAADIATQPNHAAELCRPKGATAERSSTPTGARPAYLWFMRIPEPPGTDRAVSGSSFATGVPHTRRSHHVWCLVLPLTCRPWSSAMAFKKVPSLRAALVLWPIALLTVPFATACNTSDTDEQLSRNQDGRGPITYVEGKDTTETGAVKQLIDRWNATHPDEQVTYKEQSNDASAQYDDLVEHMR